MWRRSRIADCDDSAFYKSASFAQSLISHNTQRAPFDFSHTMHHMLAPALNRRPQATRYLMRMRPVAGSNPLLPVIHRSVCVPTEPVADVAVSSAAMAASITGTMCSEIKDVDPGLLPPGALIRMFEEALGPGQALVSLNLADDITSSLLRYVGDDSLQYLRSDTAFPDVLCMAYRVITHAPGELLGCRSGQSHLSMAHWQVPSNA